MTEETKTLSLLPTESPDISPKRKYKTKSSSLPYSDIDLSNWKDYDSIETGSLWLFSSRDKGRGHKFDYHGNYIPQIATQLLTRYSKKGEIVLDLFLGSGTTAIEAANMGRKCLGVEIRSDMVEYVREKTGRLNIADSVIVLQGDSTSEAIIDPVRAGLSQLGSDSAQLLILHPPYWDIIKFSDDPSEISNSASLEEFLLNFRKVASTGFELLDSGRFAAVIIGDKYASGELVPLGFLTMQVMTGLGFRLKSIIVKNIEGNEIGKGRTNNLWRYRALAGGFYIFKHEYIFIFQKP